jgi:phage terminase large subunit-like protein
MVEGESGILACSPESNMPVYEPSKRRVTWQNGSIAIAYSADEPERLRGPQHDAAWCDELASWRYPAAWD